MSASIDAPDLRRRALLRGRAAARPALRPPWALAEPAFLDACTQCRACIRACPQHVLVVGEGGFPEFDPRRGECTFCGDCATSCTAAALDPAPGRTAWTLQPRFGDDCLARRGIVCSGCRDACGQNAIRFPLAMHRIPVPDLDTDRCTGCGACVAACVVGVIAMDRAVATERVDA